MIKWMLAVACMALGAVLVLGAFFWPWLWPASVILALLLMLGAYDLVQPRHTILRNYPVFGHLRYMLEDIRHQIRQYFIEADNKGDPFGHGERGLVYKRAKQASDVQPFGTIQDVYASGYEWFNHSLHPLEASDTPPRIRVGGPDCRQPYHASLLNVSAMSFGALSPNAILALNEGARRGGFAHNTGEGGISEYHLRPGGDLIWELGTAYFGCRTKDGKFDPAQFEDQASRDIVKMIEIKLSQGAKPGGGGILPAAKLTPAIARARGVEMGHDVESPPAHSAFSGPEGLLEFVVRLRELSGGKPVGFKLCIGRADEFLAVCRAMVDTGITPDYIVVDGGEGGTGAAPREFSDALGTPLREGLIFAHNALVGAGVRDRLKLVCSGKILSGFDMAAKIAMGADMCYSARAMLFALGCIQARRCHTNRCPTGVTTQDPWRQAGLVVRDKAPRVANYHAATIHHLMKVLAAAGLRHPDELTPAHLQRRVAPQVIKSYAELYDYLAPGSLRDGDAPESWLRAWRGTGRPEEWPELLSAST